MMPVVPQRPCSLRSALISFFLGRGRNNDGGTCGCMGLNKMRTFVFEFDNLRLCRRASGRNQFV